MKKLLSLISLLFLIGVNIFAQSHISSQAHQAAISMISSGNIEDGFENIYFSAGKDGFLVKWTDDNNGEHYQITELEIKMISVSPNGKEIAVYETDGGLINRVSVWNWETLTRKFARRFSDSVTSISYTANGNYIMVGTATVDGVVFLRSSNGDVVSNKIRESTGIVSYAITSKTEKTAVMYSPAGSLAYYNLFTGRLTKKFNVEQGLSNTVLFNNYLFLAGIKDGMIYIVYALSGKTLATIPAPNATILATPTDSNLYYLETDNRGNYQLKMLENVENKNVSSPRIVKNLKGPRGNEIINCGAKLSNDILLGSNSGDLYRINTNPETEIENLISITDNSYDKILDMCPVGEDFYFLTRNSLFKSSYDTGIVNKLGANPGQTQILTYNDKVILWSKGTKEPVQLFDYAKPELITLFTPKYNIQSVRLFGDTILEMENNSVVNTYDINSNKFTEVYTGAGLQDAVIAGDGKLYVAKSYATNPRSSLICIDMTTKETVPMPLKGNVAFALSVNNNDIYGISVLSTDVEKRTVVFSFDTVSKRTVSILDIKDEDSNAFTYLKYPILYTNFGKDRIRSCHLSTNKTFMFNRSASIPIKVSQNAARVVTLNRDGSISWYNKDLSQVLEDWYLTRDGQWYAF